MRQGDDLKPDETTDLKSDETKSTVETSESHVTYGMRRGVDLTQTEAAHKKRTAISGIIIFIMIPITVIGGSNLIGHHSYMLDSMVILIYTMIPFFMVFERRKPKAGADPGGNCASHRVRYRARP